MKKNTQTCASPGLLFVFVFTLLLLFFTPAGNAATAEGYVISELRYSIDGRTQEEVLRRRLGIEEGMVFDTKAALEEYIAEKEQLLANQRTLEAGRITLTFGPNKSVEVEVYAEDTLNVIALPYGNYDSNEGLLLSLRGRDYNFLGRMEELSIDIDYTRTVEKENEVSLASEAKIPFALWGWNWIFEFEEDTAYIPNRPLQSYARGAFDFQRSLWQGGVSAEYFLNEKTEGTTPSAEIQDPDTYYFSTTGKFGISLPVRLEVCKSVDYEPSLLATYSFKPGDTLSEERRGFAFGIEHGVSGGRIDWLGNFRSGIDFQLTHMQKYNFARQLWRADVDFLYEMHSASSRIGFSSRLKAFYSLNDAREELGSVLRGILDDRVEGDAGLMLNLAVPFKVWTWFLSNWFEGHVSPFFDYALVRQEGGVFDFGESWYGAGVELLAYPSFSRSFFARISFGIDIGAMAKGGGIGDPAARDGESRYELYIGLGHHY